MILQWLTAKRVHRKNWSFGGRCIEWHFWTDDKVVVFRVFPSHDTHYTQVNTVNCLSPLTLGEMFTGPFLKIRGSRTITCNCWTEEPSLKSFFLNFGTIVLIYSARDKSSILWMPDHQSPGHPQKYSVGEGHEPSPRAFQEKLTFSFLRVAVGDTTSSINIILFSSWTSVYQYCQNAWKKASIQYVLSELIGAFQGQWNTIKKTMKKNNKNNF